MTGTRTRTVALGTGLVVLLGAAPGCKDFLVTPPQGTLNELTLQNRAGVEASLVGTYRVLGGAIGGGVAGAAASNWVYGSVASDDAYKGSDPGDAAQITDVELYTWGAGGAQGFFNEKWTSVYEGISRANATLRLISAVRAARPGEISEADANVMRGEALFLRAHFHFEGWRMWGNIPFYTEEDTDFRKPNIAPAEVAKLILADLDAAIGLLGERKRNNQVGRVDRWIARAYKGRVQVHTGDFAGGLTTLRAVEQSGQYALEENFHRVWTGFQQFANGKETILAYQASANDGDPNGQNANHGERLNFPHAGSPFGCCGFHQPSQNLVNFFVVDANGLPAALSAGNDLASLRAADPWNARDEMIGGGSTLPVDPRLDWTVGRDEVPYKDWGLHKPAWIRDPANGGRYSPKKNVHEKASGAESKVGWVPTQLNSVNMHLYRYADLLLLLAEAEVEVGSLENARALVNRIRRRAGVAAQGPGADAATISVPINDPRITWANYRVGEYAAPWTDRNLARQAVRYERRLELAMEGQRFFDLRRWGIAAQVLNDYTAVERRRRPYLGGATAVAGRHQFYPIPVTQIERSRVDGQDRLKQNEGW